MSPPVAIDFAALSLQDALDLAILIEEEAQERYLEFVDQMQQHHTPEADEELLHQSLVRETMRNLPAGEEPDAAD